MNLGKLIIPVQPVIDYSVGKLCCKPYYGHPKGCPNFSKKKGCPPSAPLYDEIYDISKTVYAVCNVFNFKNHVERI